MLSIKVDAGPLKRQLAALGKQLPFALATAINDLAFRAMRAENDAITHLFKHPKPFTQSATQVERRATKANLAAVVSLRPNRARYLAPYETGGVHALSGRALLNPKDIGLDQFGQLPRNIIKRLQSRKDIFIGTFKGIKGVWQKFDRAPTGRGRGRPKKGQNTPPAPGQGVKLLIRFGDALPVHQRLGFRARATGVVRAEAPAALAAAIAKALASKR